MSGDFNSTYTDKLGLFCQKDKNRLRMIRTYNLFKNKKKIKSKREIKIQVFYYRSDCVLRYLKLGVNNNYYSIVESNALKFIYLLNEPMHIHLALTNRKDQMRIMWVSGSNIKSPCVHYGRSRNYNKITCGVTTTYKSTDMCEPPASTDGYIDPGYIHDVVLSKLLPDTTYYYSVGSNKSFSDSNSFKTRKSFSCNNFPISIVAFGDLSTGKPTGPYQTIDSIDRLRWNKYSPDLILHIGDISYARGKVMYYQINVEGYVWDEFGFMIQKVAAYIPYMVSIGNHEHLYKNGQDKDPSKEKQNFIPSANLHYNSGGECSVPMVKRFKMPDNGNGLFWYSFDYGLVHVIMLSSELSFKKGSNQYNWLFKDFMKINRTEISWIIVTMHRPMYSSVSEKEAYLTKLIRLHIEPILIQFKVDFFLNGHVHQYERTCPINNEECVKENKLDIKWGIRHFTIGSGGMLDKVKIKFKHP
ncbi:hypothetical protein HZS_2159, partial [Henneguya salminicola]